MLEKDQIRDGLRVRVIDNGSLYGYQEKYAGLEGVIDDEDADSDDPEYYSVLYVRFPGEIRRFSFAIGKLVAIETQPEPEPEPKLEEVCSEPEPAPTPEPEPEPASIYAAAFPSFTQDQTFPCRLGGAFGA